MKIYTYALLLLFLAWPPVSSWADTNPLRDSHELTILSGKNTIKAYVEFAKSSYEQKLGLMHRVSLPENHGMLFINDKEHEFGVWMKNTQISLDAIFMNGKKEIIHIIQNLRPYSEEIYLSGKNSQYLLEVPSGFIKKHNIQIGDKIIWHNDQL